MTSTSTSCSSCSSQEVAEVVRQAQPLALHHRQRRISSPPRSPSRVPQVGPRHSRHYLAYLDAKTTNGCMMVSIPLLDTRWLCERTFAAGVKQLCFDGTAFVSHFGFGGVSCRITVVCSPLSHLTRFSGTSVSFSPASSSLPPSNRPRLAGLSGLGGVS